jgi:hypothetical protein
VAAVFASTPHEPERSLPGENAPPDEVFLKPPTQRRLPVVAGANALIPNVIHHAREQFSFLTLLIERELITLASAVHIREEVAEYLPGRAARYGVADAAERSWKEAHEPLIHFVELAGDEFTDDHRLIEVAGNDEDDVPAAQLGLLLAPAMVLTRDRDLTDVGIGLGYWVEPARVLLKLAEMEEQMYGQAHGAALLLTISARALGAGGKALTRSPVLTGLAVALAIMALTDWRQGSLSVLVRLRSAAGVLLERGLPLIADAFDRHESAQAKIEATLLQPLASPDLCSMVARLLAQSGAPCPPARLLDDLHRRGRKVSEHNLRSLLADHPAFVAVRGQGWQLGQLG